MLLLLLCNKIYTKCPLRFSIVKSCTIFSPEKIQPEKAKYLKQKANLLFQIFVKLNLLTFSKADRAYI